MREGSPLRRPWWLLSVIVACADLACTGEAPPPPTGPIGMGAALTANGSPVAPSSGAKEAPGELGWDLLASFPYHRLASDPVKGRIPPAILGLDGRPIRITGHMLPTRFAPTQRVASFLLSRTSMECCFGQPPRVNEWIWVEVADPGGTDHVLVTVEVAGRLSVGEYADSYGDVGGVYRMTAESVRVNRIAGHPANRPPGDSPR